MCALPTIGEAVRPGIGRFGESAVEGGHYSVAPAVRPPISAVSSHGWAFAARISMSLIKPSFLAHSAFPIMRIRDSARL